MDAKQVEAFLGKSGLKKGVDYGAVEYTEPKNGSAAEIKLSDLTLSLPRAEMFHPMPGDARSVHNLVQNDATVTRALDALRRGLGSGEDLAGFRLSIPRSPQESVNLTVCLAAPSEAKTG